MRIELDQTAFRADMLVGSCPNTGYQVQGFVAEETSDDSETYHTITCVACQQVHLVNPTTGKVIGEGE